MANIPSAKQLYQLQDGTYLYIWWVDQGSTNKSAFVIIFPDVETYFYIMLTGDVPKDSVVWPGLTDIGNFEYYYTGARLVDLATLC